METLYIKDNVISLDRWRDKKNNTRCAFSDTPSNDILNGIHPDVYGIVEEHGMDFVNVLKLAYDWFVNEMKRMYIRKIKDIRLDPLWSYYPLPYMSEVLFLDPEAGQLYLMTSSPDLTMFHRIKNSEDILQRNDRYDENLFRHLLGGIHAYNEDIAHIWQYQLRVRD